MIVKRLKTFFAGALCLSMLMTSLAGCGGGAEDIMELDLDEVMEQADDSQKEELNEYLKDAKDLSDTKEEADKDDSDTSVQLSDIKFSGRPSIISKFMKLSYKDVKPSVPSYEVEPDLSNVINLDQFYNGDNDDVMEMLAENQFVVMPWGGDEFFDIYEPNRYDYIPNFITVDSMLHTYHLYFAYLLKRTEMNELADMVEELTEDMLEGTVEQYEVLEGSEWEDAARTNLIFFSVASSLFDEDTDVPDEVKDIVEEELEKIGEADRIDYSPVIDDLQDYSQYKPRGYYDTDEKLKKYFKAMMWYGRVPFQQKSETLDRSALLINLLLNGDDLEMWERVYTVTSFFAGVADDSGYYEYKPVIDAVYGEDPDIESLIGDDAKFEEYHRLTGELPAPRINSVPVFMTDSDEEVAEKNTGFRFMSQRFTIDASIFGKLIYRAVKENSMGGLRMLPDALDVPAALGSDAAYDILEEEGNMDYENYEENLDQLIDDLKDAPEETWEVSLYSGWLNTLRPLLESKGEGYPGFMQSSEWDKKNLSTFLGSYTELKHDTILYAKQIMAEMGDGGEEPEERDDRGYVEPEPEVFARLSGLVQSTRDGLDSYDLLDKDTISDLDILEELCDRLQAMAEKELRGELLDDDEYELIRDFGGQIEHFWQVAKRDEAGSDYFSSYEYPAALVADIATDPNGAYLEVANGNPNVMLVIIEVDGKLKIAEGAVYDFYEFPFNERLTDGEWRKIIGAEWDDEGKWYDQYHDTINHPQWTDSYRYEYDR